MVTVVTAPTALVEMGNVALVWLSSTVTVAGTCAAALSLERLTTAPPAGAALVRLTVPVEDWPPVTLDGLALTD